jgi:vacuolar-type H+-ATPase subunit E/Vma4
VSSREREQVLAARRAARRSAFEVERAGAQRRAAARVLTAQHALLDRVFARASALGADARSDARHLDALPQQIAAILGYLGGQPATLRCGPQLAAPLRALVADGRDVELVVDDALPAGFVVATLDGSCTIDCTLPVRLAALRPRLEAGLIARVQR